MKNLLFIPVALLIITLFSGIAYAKITNDTEETSENSNVSTARVLIGFTEKPGKSEEQLITQNGGTVSHTYHLVSVIAASIPETAISGLLQNPRVTYIEYDDVLTGGDIVPWGVDHIDADLVQATGVTGQGVRVAIIDSGIDVTHSDLRYAGGYDFVNNDTDPLDDYGHGTHVAGTVAALNNGTGIVGVSPNVELYILKVLSSEN